MDKQFLEPIKELEYANLDNSEERRLREFEKNFNEEFKKSIYFLAVKKK